MYLAYFDESGYSGDNFDPQKPFQVLAGIIMDCHRFHKTTGFMEYLVNVIRERNIRFVEFKADDFYNGRGVWQELIPDGTKRHELFWKFLAAFKKRKHQVFLSVIDQKKFFECIKAEEFKEIGSVLTCPYLAAAFHAGLAIQNIHQSKKRKKGLTILIFDEQVGYQDRLQKIYSDPPKWASEFYKKGKEDNPFTQILDPPYFGKSHLVYPIQIADMYAFVCRKYVELKFGGFSEKYEGEKKKIENLFSLIKPRLIPELPRGSAKILNFYRSFSISSKQL